MQRKSLTLAFNKDQFLGTQRKVIVEALLGHQDIKHRAAHLFEGVACKLTQYGTADSASVEIADGILNRSKNKPSIVLALRQVAKGDVVQYDDETFEDAMASTIAIRQGGQDILFEAMAEAIPKVVRSLSFGAHGQKGIDASKIVVSEPKETSEGTTIEISLAP